MWRRIWGRQSEMLWWRCTHAFASPACSGILCSAILARKAAIRRIFPKHSRVSFHPSLHIVMPRKLYSPLFLFSDSRPTVLDLELQFLYCGVRKPSFGRFGHIQGQAHVRLFQLYPTSLPCVSCRHVEYLQEISCCIYRLDSAITSTIYISVASCKVDKAWLVHSRRFLSLNSSVKIPERTTSRCSILRTVRRNALVDHGGFPLQAAINWSRSSSRSPAECDINYWRPCTSTRLHLHPIACCFLFFLIVVLRTILNCACSVRFLVAAFAASRWAKWCRRCSWVSAGCVSDETAVVLLDSVPLSPCCGARGAMIHCCQDEKIMIMKRSGKSWGRR